MKTIFKHIISFIFPNYCKNCSKLLNINDQHCFCNECWNTITLIKDKFCKKCGKPVITPEGICQSCKNIKSFYNQIRVAGIYENVLKEAIHLFKYSQRWKLVNNFLSLIKNSIDKSYILDHDFIIPVPMSKRSIQQRGFDHINLISKKLSDEFNIPVKQNILLKIRETQPQSLLKREQRLSNLSGCFKLNKKHINIIKNKRILILDDVYTTGSTIREVSKEIKKYNVKEINALTIARGR